MTLADLSPELKAEADRLMRAIPDGSKPYAPGMTAEKAGEAVEAYVNFLVRHQIRIVAFTNNGDFARPWDLEILSPPTDH